MRSLPVWKCLNKTTPYSWFDKYERFLTFLAYEMGFISVKVSEVDKLGTTLYMKMEFLHSEGNSFTFHLLRNRIFYGGGISLKGSTSQVMMTATLVNKGTMVESRTEVGNWFIEVLRENWIN
tara:strand:+ start:840 stop:1205 length:366 start_codon:yes stop_codon:yes gene_type:complete